MGFWNVREYVLYRDGHRCHGEKNCKNKILNAHHIETRKTGGDSPDNLITLCEQYHKKYHQGKLKRIWTRGQSFKIEGNYIQVSTKYKQMSLNDIKLVSRNNNWVCHEVA